MASFQIDIVEDDKEQRLIVVGAPPEGEKFDPSTNRAHQLGQLLLDQVNHINEFEDRMRAAEKQAEAEAAGEEKTIIEAKTMPSYLTH